MDDFSVNNLVSVIGAFEETNFERLRPKRSKGAVKSKKPGSHPARENPLTTKEHLRLHDKLRNLMREGIEVVTEIRSLTLETRKDLRELAASQKKTDASLKALIDGWAAAPTATRKRKHLRNRKVDRP